MEESKFQLIRQKLLRINYEVNDKFNFSEKIKLNVKTNALVQKDEKNRKANVLFVLTVYADEEISQVPFKLETINKGLFEWEETADDRIDTLLNINAPALLLSYVRPLITQFTSFSGYPPLILPLIDFTKNHNNK